MQVRFLHLSPKKKDKLKFNYMETSTEFSKVFRAINEVRRSVDGVLKDGVNPHFKSRYATLSSVYTAINQSLDSYGLGVIQTPESSSITTLIQHYESGEWIKSTLTISLAQSTPQNIGSMITYFRRYALMTIFGLTLKDDDDGNKAQEAFTQPKPNQSQVNIQPQSQQPQVCQQVSGKRVYKDEYIHRADFRAAIDRDYDVCVSKNVGFSLREWATNKFQITELQLVTLDNWYYGK